MSKTKHQPKQGRAVLVTIAGLVVLGFAIAIMIRGADIPLLQPKGKIAGEQFRLMVTVTGLLVGVAIPSLLAFYLTVWKYRESNKRSSYEPHTRYGRLFVIFLWGIPATIAFSLALLLWPATHKLEPRKAISSDSPPISIQVIALRWKWLFIYPEQGIATVNYIQVPVNTPIQFDLTADEAPMSSFWIPHLGGQLYAMTGHVNRLNLMADTLGDFTGSTAEINGAGFAGMRFTTHSSTDQDFEQWVNEVRNSPKYLDAAEYDRLLEPSENNSVEVYANVDTSLYPNLLAKYAGMHNHQMEQK